MRSEMENCIIGIDHIGYAVKDIEEARPFFEVLGFSFTKERADRRRSVNVSVGSLGG